MLWSRATARVPFYSLLSRQWLSSLVRPNVRYGQPLHETHPHLLNAGELTPGIQAAEYARRRTNLANALPQNSVAVLAASDVRYRAGTAVFYKFHQDSNFFYLTGFNEPDALAVIVKTSGTRHDFRLFVRPKDTQRERWEGSRSGLEAAQTIFNADEAEDINNISLKLPDIIDGASKVFTDIPTSERGHSTFSKIMYGSTSLKAHRFGEMLQKANVRPLRPIMNELRVLKSDAEIRNMQHAGQASGRAIAEAMRRNYHTEGELESFLEYEFRRQGCDGSAYIPVVAGGESANIIHYVRNDDILRKEDLVTVDAGGEYGSYITDITRAWPVGQKFSTPQRDLYEVVLDVQKTCISLCSEDADMSLDKLHRIAENGLKRGLSELGFDMTPNTIEILFPHHLSHYIGLDVHDGPGYPRSSRLRAGNCVTVEPGIYLDDNERWPRHFRRTGIRIEDSICVGKDSAVVLTSEAPKEIRDIELQRSFA